MEDGDSNQEQRPSRTSKISALISENENQNENSPGISVNVCYSENNWETCDIVVVVVDNNTTVEDLINSALYKLKTELLHDNIDEKKFDLMLFKKKIKKPNYNYPKCNLDSLVKDYAKSYFCLIESDSKEKIDNVIKNKESSTDDKLLSLETGEAIDDIKKQVEQTDKKNKNKKEKKENNEKTDSNLSFQKCCCGCKIF